MLRQERQDMAAAKDNTLIRTEDYEGPDRRLPDPPKAYDKTIANSEARLPEISPLGASIVALAMENMSPRDAAVLALHLNHRLREASIERSRAAAEEGLIEKGTLVRLSRVATVSPKYEGRVGTVQRVVKLRCYVKLRGVSRPFYVYLAEVEALSPSEAKRLEKDTGPGLRKARGRRQKDSTEAA